MATNKNMWIPQWRMKNPSNNMPTIKFHLIPKSRWMRIIMRLLKRRINMRLGGGVGTVNSYTT